jgi:hypothetical protein
VIEVNGVPLRDLLIAQAGLQRVVRVIENGRRVQYTDTGFLSRPRVERVQADCRSVIWANVAVRNTRAHRVAYGPRDEPLIDKFMRKVEKSADGHWRWTGHLTKQGYGRFSVKIDGKSRTVAAHRWIYEYMIRPLGPEETIDHLNEICGVRSCVNVEHLDPCSGGENARRARVRHSLAGRDICNNNHVLSEVGTSIDGKGTVLCNACTAARQARSNRSYFQRRAYICYQLGLSFIVCENNHRLDLEKSLLSSGRCRACHRERAQRDRDRKKGVFEEEPKIKGEC